jgi:hypothetical protein
MLGDDEIRDILQSSPEISEGCRRLVARANEHGGEDNITAVLVRIDDGAPGGEDSTRPPPAADGESTVRGMPVSDVGLKPQPLPDSGSLAITQAPPPPPSLDSESTLPGIAPPPARGSQSGDKRR